MLGVDSSAVYLDYAATTPVDPAVLDAMSGFLGVDGTFGNPASIHSAGRQADEAVEIARDQLASLVKAEARELTFTSGATESVNLAVIGAARFRSDRGKHLITMPTEHKAATGAFAALEREGFEVSYLLPDADGLLSIDKLTAAIRDDTQLVSVMHVNNETGVIQDIERIGECCRERDVLYHVDAAQSVELRDFVQELGGELHVVQSVKRLTLELQRTQIGIVCLEALSRSCFQRLLFLCEKSHVQHLGHVLGDRGLNLEDIVENAIEGIRPDVGIGGHADQLGADPRSSGPTVACIANRTFEDVLNTQFLPDLTETLLGVLVLHGACTRDDAEAPKAWPGGR